jgi:hypothetical protein
LGCNTISVGLVDGNNVGLKIGSFVGSNDVEGGITSVVVDVGITVG